MTIDGLLPFLMLYEWAGGSVALERFFTRFYERVPDDAILVFVFARMDPAYVRHVAAFVAEIFGGLAMYSAEHGGHPYMICKHLARALDETKCCCWIGLLLDVADEVGLPDDPEFRSAFVAYLEWGTRLVVINSQPGAIVVEDALMPQWGWGVPGGPYVLPQT